MEEILKNISVNDLEKLKLLLSIIPGHERKEVVTLRVFRDEYLNLIKNSRSKSYYISVNISFDHLTDFLSNQFSINSIQAKDIENFLIHIQKKVKKGYRVYYRTLKAAFNKAVEWGYVNVNHFQKVKLPKKQQVNPAFINCDQLTLICEKIESGVVKDIAKFGFYTGMRLNEIINLTWRNVDLSAKVITVGDDKFTTKGRNQRYIPISDEAFEILRSIENEKQKGNQKVRLITLARNASNTHFNKNEFVFCKKDGSKYCGNYVSRKFKNACIATEMNEAIHFHSLRHSFASNLVQKGVPLYTIKELLGHSSISTTEIYSHLNMDSLREAIAKFDGRNTKDEVKEKDAKGHTPSFPLSRGESNEVKIFRINSGEKR